MRGERICEDWSIKGMGYGRGFESAGGEWKKTR
jgi:hypothetical protein